MAPGRMARPVVSTTAARRLRAELLGGIQRLEHAIDAPVGDPSWRPGMTRAIAQLRAAFTQHVDVTEGPTGHYAGLLEDAPRLARGLSELVDEHEAVLSALNALEDRLHPNQVDTSVDSDVAEVRRQAAQVLREVWQHRQRGADLVYEAYSTDIGGET
jgi:hypothetical protein